MPRFSILIPSSPNSCCISLCSSICEFGTRNPKAAVTERKSSTYLVTSAGNSPVSNGSFLASSISVCTIASASASKSPELEAAPNTITRLRKHISYSSNSEANIPISSSRFAMRLKAFVRSVFDSRIIEFLCLRSSANTARAQACVLVHLCVLRKLELMPVLGACVCPPSVAS